MGCKKRISPEKKERPRVHNVELLVFLSVAIPTHLFRFACNVSCRSFPSHFFAQEDSEITYVSR